MPETPEQEHLSIVRLLAKMPTIAAWACKNQMKHPVNYPKNSLDYCSNFLYMMFALPVNLLDNIFSKFCIGK